MDRQAVAPVHVQCPGPARGRAAAGRQGPRETVGPERMGLPIGADCLRQGFRDERHFESVPPNRIGERLTELGEKVRDGRLVAALLPRAAKHKHKNDNKKLRTEGLVGHSISSKGKAGRPLRG
jgi:hypothetical protein